MAVAYTFNPFTGNLDAVGFLGSSLIVEVDGIAITSTDGIVAENLTAATVGVPVQMSPRVRWHGTGWDTDDAVNRTVDFIAELLPVSGTVVSGQLKFGYSFNGASYVYPFVLGGDTVNAFGSYPIATFRYDSNRFEFIEVRNATSGAASRTGLILSTDTDSLGYLGAFSSSWTTSGVLQANSVALISDGQSLDLAARAANGDINFWAGGSTNRWKIQSDGKFYPIAANSYDVGASGNEARSGYFGTSVKLGTSGAFGVLKGPSDGVVTLLNTAETSFGRLQIGGTTASFPAIKRNNAEVYIRLADDSDYANLSAQKLTSANDVVAGSNVQVGSGGYLQWSTNKSRVYSRADGQLVFFNSGDTAGVGIDFNTAGLLKIQVEGNNAFGSVQALAVISGAGTGTGTYNAAGALNVQTSSVGVGNGADATDDTLFTYSLPSGSLSANGKGVKVRAWGKTAANANTKDIKLWFAGTTVADSGALNLNNAAWSVEFEAIRIDATHVSVVGTWNDNGLTTGDVIIQANLVVADLTANASVIKVTGASTITGAASDVLGYGMKTEFLN